MKSVLRIIRYLEQIHSMRLLTHQAEGQSSFTKTNHMYRHTLRRLSLLASGFVLCFAFVASSHAQASAKARIQFDMPWIAPENENNVALGNLDFDIYAVSRGKSYKLRYWGRILKPGSFDFVDRYTSTLPPGKYSLHVRLFENYLLPIVTLGKGEIYSFVLPISRLSSATECVEGRIFGSWVTENERHFNRTDVHTKLVDIGGPNDIAAHFCSTRRIGEVIIFKSARIYYKDYYLEADEVRIDVANRILTAVNESGEPMIYRKGSFEKSNGKVFSISF